MGVAALLVLCSGAASGCYDFTYEEPATDAGADASAGDAARPPGGDAGTACISGGAYCGGDRVIGAADTLYRCELDGGSVLVKRCAGGCTADAGNGEGARCNPSPAPCQVGGAYCGGDKLDGDPGILYRCAAGGAPTILERCKNGCRVMPAGTDDVCAP